MAFPQSLRTILLALGCFADSRWASIRRDRGVCSLFLLTVLSCGQLWSQNDTSDVNSGEEQYIKPRLSGQIISPAVGGISGAAIPDQPNQYLPLSLRPPPSNGAQLLTASADTY